MTDPDNFLSRWSKRKREAEKESAAQQQPVAESTKDLATPTHDTEPAFDLSQLPSLESIGPGTDIRIFLQAGVPAALSRAALRRAWAADPQISTFIGLSENAWDFTATDSMTGFGALDPGEAQRIFAQLLGDRDPKNPGDAALQEADDADAVAASSALEGNPAHSGLDEQQTIVDNAATQNNSSPFTPDMPHRNILADEVAQASIPALNHAEESADEPTGRPPNTRRPHGGALPT